MKNTVQTLLAELLENYPEFKENEAALRKFIQQFLKARPDSVINADFKKKLRAELMARAETFQSYSHSGWKSFFHVHKKPIFAGFMSIAIALVVIPLWNQIIREEIPESVEILSEQKMDNRGFQVLNIIENTQEEAFGDIPSLENESVVNEKMMDSVAYGRGGGGGVVYTEPMIMPNPWGERINYEYSYDGVLPTFDEKVTVYKGTFDQFEMPFSRLNFPMGEINLLDMSAFEDLQVENFQFTEDRDMGYSVSFNFRYPSISIYENYDQWRPYHENCSNGTCQPLKQFTEKDILSDTELIRIADDFLKEYGIDSAHLGTPTVQKYWEEPTYDAKMVPEYFPDTLTVQYPFVVEGKTIVDQGGNMQGISVGVNMRAKKVSNANFTPLSLESSMYASLDEESIRSAVNEGGLQGFRYSNPDKIISLTLTNPDLKLVKIQRYNRIKNNTDEFYVPAIVFEIEEPDSKENMDTIPRYYYQRSIIVPLVKNVELK